jgi:hypothetical protein
MASLLPLLLLYSLFNPRHPEGSFKKSIDPKDQKSYVLPHMWTLDQGQTQQGDWTLST